MGLAPATAGATKHSASPIVCWSRVTLRPNQLVSKFDVFVSDANALIGATLTSHLSELHRLVTYFNNLHKLISLR
jgi:hypothetical protein